LKTLLKKSYNAFLFIISLKNFIMKKIVVAVFFCLVQTVFAQISLPYIFSDNMVLQRGQKIPVWGFSSPNETIKVAFKKQLKETKANEKGEWMVYLNQEKAGGPYLLTVSGKNKITFKNVLIGDVWLASGQSNMEWNLAATEGYDNELNQTKFPLIRHIKINKKINSLPQNNVTETHWDVANKQTIGDFSAVAYHFAKKMYQEKGVPVGIINSSWGGTVIESWIPREAFEQSPYFKEMISKMPKVDIEQLEQNNIAEKTILMESLTQEKISDFSANNFLTETSTSPKAEINVPQAWEEQGYKSLDGIIWVKKTIVLAENDVKKDATLYLGKIDDADTTFFNGKEVGGMKQWSDERIYTISKEFLKVGENTIAIKITDTGGGGGLWDNSEDIKLVTSDRTLPLKGKWKFGIEKIFSAINQNEFPSLIYNSMIYPFIKTRISGVVWYQGESNVERAEEYEKTFPLLINSWREKFGKNLPFYFVQLATFNNDGNSNEGCPWAELRDAQTQALSLKNTGMAVTTDVGNPTDIHPRNKKPVGERLANLALKNGIYSPVLKSYTVKGDKIEVTLTGKSMLIAKDQQSLRGFEIAGKDQVFYPATASIVNNKLVVTSDKVSNPTAVRYGWKADNSELNLFTKELLPVSPFRTDNFKLKTKGVQFSLK
jgi:sialate O-acetylesterase